MSLSTIETSYSTHTTKCVRSFDHADIPVIRLASEVLNAAEGFLWVRCAHLQCACLPLLAILSDIFGDLASLMVPSYPSTPKPDNLVSHCIAYVDIVCISFTNNISFQASNSIQAYKEAARLVKGLADGTVLHFHLPF